MKSSFAQFGMSNMRDDGRGAMTRGFRCKIQMHRLIVSPFAPRIGAIEANVNTSGAGETGMSDADWSHRGLTVRRGRHVLTGQHRCLKYLTFFCKPWRLICN